MATVTSTTVVRDGARSQHVQPEVISLIADYEIYQSWLESTESISNGTVVIAGVEREAQPAQFDPTLAPHPRVPHPASNPFWWQFTFRRVPDYRPVNYGLDLSERRQNLIFTIVGGTMVLGCYSLGVSSVSWHLQDCTTTDQYL